MTKSVTTRAAASTLLVFGFLLGTGCAISSDVADEGEAVAVRDDAPPQVETEAAIEESPIVEDGEQGEVPLVIAESEQREVEGVLDQVAEIVVGARLPDRHEVIHDLVAEAQALLRDVELKYFFTGKAKREVLRGRPVA
ncbi:MAG: hypothetical protein ABIT61_08980, partial [Steroidobacteraceae bacterium]